MSVALKVIHLQIERARATLEVRTVLRNSSHSMLATPSEAIAVVAHVLTTVFVAGDTIVYCNATFSCIGDVLRAVSAVFPER